jgi:hypothetical protein
MPVVVGSIGKKHASEALHWAAEEALYRAAALCKLGRSAAVESGHRQLR